MESEYQFDPYNMFTVGKLTVKVYAGYEDIFNKITGKLTLLSTDYIRHRRLNKGNTWMEIYHLCRHKFPYLYLEPNPSKIYQYRVGYLLCRVAQSYYDDPEIAWN